MIEHLTLVIAGACLVGYGEFIDRHQQSPVLGIVWGGIGVVLFTTGAVPALLGALGL